MDLLLTIRWRPGIGDPTFMGWLTVAAYAIAAFTALLAARRAGRAPGTTRGSRGMWLLVAAFMALLCLNKQLDLQSLLTDIGRQLSKLPLDPRVGRMILEAVQRQALTEVLVIASALSGQDVRDRPLEQAQAADEKHKPFDDEKSEFMGYLKLWQWIEEGRGHGAPLAPAPGLAPRPAPSKPACAWRARPMPR